MTNKIRSDYFINNVQLHDDELSLIQTSLKLTIDSFERYAASIGVDNVNLMDKEAIEEMKVLHKKLNEKYF